jgi:hypothetical protein
MRSMRSMRPRIAMWVAWSLVALAVAFGLATLALDVAVTSAAAVPDTPIPPETIAALQHSGVSGLSALFALGEAWGFAVLGAVLVSRRYAPALGWLFCALGLELTVEYFTDFYAIYTLFVAPGTLPGGLAAAWVQQWVWLVGIMLLVALVPLRFPTGRLVSPRWRPAWWLAVGATAAAVPLVAIAPGPLGNNLAGANVANPLGVAGLAAAPAQALVFTVLVALLVSIVLAAASLVVRLRRARGVERQQIKWVACCALLLALAFVAQTVVNNVLGISSPLVDLASSLGLGIGLVGLPITTGIAILRYHLFDIDVIIRLTLIYGTLTALLAGAYLGLVLAAEAVVHSLTGQAGDEPPVIVASTLVVVALATPLRRGVQAAIDRRFYRRRVDAERTIAAFGATLRSEVDLEQLSARLVAVVEETMQPAHASFWLRLPGRSAQPAPATRDR